MRLSYRRFAGVVAIAAICCVGAAGAAFGADWSTTEFQLQYGKLDTPTFAGGGDSDTKIGTLQHASGWKYGDNFFFIDFANGEETGFNDREMYAEFYANFSLNKMRGKDNWSGAIADVGFIAGINWSTDLRIRKFLPGIRLSWNIPKFAFANLDITAYIDDNEGVANGGVPREDDSFMIDFNWALPFSIGNQDFSIEGHIEYIGERDDEFGNEVKWHILAQPQLRYDVGKALGGDDSADRFFIGLELQVWINKLGDDETDEFAPQALFVWRF